MLKSLCKYFLITEDMSFENPESHLLSEPLKNSEKTRTEELADKGIQKPESEEQDIIPFWKRQEVQAFLEGNPEALSCQDKWPEAVRKVTDECLSKYPQ